jgi:hypothetical protein
MSNWSTKVNVRIVSSNPLIKILNLIMATLQFITGIRKSGILSEENDYIIIDTKTRVLWFFLKSEDILKISRSKIAGIKVSTTKSMIFFRSTIVQIFAAGVTQEVAYEVKVAYKEIKEKADAWLT